MKIKVYVILFLLLEGVYGSAVAGSFQQRDTSVLIPLEELREIDKDVKEVLEEQKKLKAQKDELLVIQKDLEKREFFYSTGLFTTLFGGAIGLLGMAIRSPHRKLEKELKELEIIEKKKILSDMGIELKTHNEVI